MQEAVKILSMFVPKGTAVVTTKGRNERQDYRTESEPILPDLPLAVLVNGNTASASEIVAGALQDLDRAVLIGQRSFGKGLVQTTRPLGYNTMLKLTTAKYYIPSGRCIQAIDYSHSQEGSVRVVPDSLVSEFTTRAGRKVYDGGGIMPDIATEPEYISRFAATLYALGFIEDFGDDYTRRHPGQRIDLRTFSITDADYADFVEFMQDKEVPYESDTRRALKALKKAAEDDRFAELKERFERVEAELKDDTRTNLETYREQVVDAINNDIVLRHGYTAGVIEHAIWEQLGEEEITYSDLVTIQRDSAGTITALTTNTAAMNQLRAELIGVVLEALDGVDVSQIQIPLGSLVDLDLLWGLGPTMKVHAMTVGTVEGEFQSQFSSAGVNQTLHKIDLELAVPLTLMLPGGAVETVCETQIPIAETVIVGQVPQIFLQNGEF